MTLDPFFRDDFLTLYCEDSLIGLPQLSPFSTNGAVAITDPMYNVGFDFGPEMDDSRPADEYADWCRRWFSMLRESGVATIAFTPGITNLPMWYQFYPPRWVISWYKPNVRAPNRWEPVLVYGESRGDDVIAAQIDYDDTRISWHGCPKPYGWAEGLLFRTVQYPEQMIIEPFAGSGTVPTTCARFGLSCIAFEKQERFCEQMAKLWTSERELETRAEARALYQHTNLW